MQAKHIPPLTLETCHECGGINLICDHYSGETVCGCCGVVLRELMIDNGPEWRAFTQEERASRSRVGMPTSYYVHDKGLPTFIGQGDRDAFGRKLPLSTKLQMWRLRRRQIRSRVHSSMDRNLAKAMPELSRLSDKAYIPRHVKDEAAVIYRKALDKNFVRGRSITAVVAASLYAACRIAGIPRTLREIAEASFVGTKDVGRCYRLMLRDLKVQMPIADPLKYVSKISERLGISGQTQGLAIKVLREAKRKHIATGKYPTGLAAAALYLACLERKEKKTQKHIAEVAGVTEVTLRNRSKRLKSLLNLCMF